MSTLVMDTHAFVKRLTEAGMPTRQAEVLAEEQVRLIEAELVTRSYLDAQLHALELRLQLRIGAMIFALGGVLLAAKFFGA